METKDIEGMRRSPTQRGNPETKSSTETSNSKAGRTQELVT